MTHLSIFLPVHHCYYNCKSQAVKSTWNLIRRYQNLIQNKCRQIQVQMKNCCRNANICKAALKNFQYAAIRREASWYEMDVVISRDRLNFWFSHLMSIHRRLGGVSRKALQIMPFPMSIHSILKLVSLWHIARHHHSSVLPVSAFHLIWVEFFPPPPLSYPQITSVAVTQPVAVTFFVT